MAGVAKVVLVRVLGGFEASVGETKVAPGAWRLRKAQTLVKLLALEPGHRLHRERVIDELWPDLDLDAGRNNLNQVLHAARKALSTLGVDGAAALGLQGDLVVLGPGGEVVTDLEQLESAVREAQLAADRGAMAAALEESPGELLPEDAYEPWAQRHAVSFREWRSRLVMELVDAQLSDGDPEAAVALLAPVVSADPLHEPAHRAMMRALAAAGRRAEALLVFERFRTVLEQELAAEPEPETRKVFRDLQLREAIASESVDLPPRVAGNLPAPVVALVGRRRELGEVNGILGRTRLLTLTGSGGAGKTALAVELARQRAADYPDGVYLVELGSLADGELVVPEVARSLGLQLPSHPHAMESLGAQLRHRQILMVLDNCEHLLDACARLLAGLLRGCPGLSVVATSREPLRIDGEVAWRTPSLGLPDVAHLPPVQDMAQVPAVKLFVERASAAAPDFVLTADNAAAVAEICYRLDGMPLALELAAACIPMLAPQQIADRLGDALTLLRRGGRTSIDRQQTLEATLAWSHDLLGDDEKTLFRRTAVFAGSFTLDAVESVCGRGMDRQVLPALARLIDTSLVVAESRGDGTRYRLLETVRQYATERLRSAGEHAELQQRHCDWYVRFAQIHDAEQSPIDEDQVSLDVEHDNLRMALTWSLHHQPYLALELAVSLSRYWLMRGYFAEGRQWLEAALSAVPEPSLLRVRALLALGVFDIRRGSGRRLAEIGAEAVAVHRAQGDREDLARALHADAVLAYMRGRWTECWQRSIEVQDVAADCGADQIELTARHLQAMVLLGRGQLSLARAAFDEVRDGLPALSAATRPFFPPVMLGFAVEHASTGSPRLYFEETVLIGRTVGAEQAAAYVHSNLAYLARLAGDLDEALALLHHSISLFTAASDRDGEALALNHLGCVHRVRGEYREGRNAFERSLRLRRATGDRRAVGLTLGNLGVLTASEGGIDAGAALLEQALAGFDETQDAAGRVGTVLTMTSAGVEIDGAAAQRLAEALDESSRIPGNHRVTAWGYAMLSDAHRRLGHLEEAGRALQRAGDLFDALHAVDGATYVRVHAGALQIRR